MIYTYLHTLSPHDALPISPTDHSPAANIPIVFDRHIPVAANPRRKSHIIADDAIMLDIGIEVCVKTATNPSVGRQCNEWRQKRARTDLHILHGNGALRRDARNFHPRSEAPRLDPSTHQRLDWKSTRLKSSH